MKATEAFKITQANQLTLEKVQEQIKMAAKSGQNFTTFIVYISVERIGQLISDGYKVSSGTDMSGFGFTKVEW